MGLLRSVLLFSHLYQLEHPAIGLSEDGVPELLGGPCRLEESGHGGIPTAKEAITEVLAAGEGRGGRGSRATL